MAEGISVTIPREYLKIIQKELQAGLKRLDWDDPRIVAINAEYHNRLMEVLEWINKC